MRIKGGGGGGGGGSSSSSSYASGGSVPTRAVVRTIGAVGVALPEQGGRKRRWRDGCSKGRRRGS